MVGPGHQLIMKDLMKIRLAIFQQNGYICSDLGKGNLLYCGRAGTSYIFASKRSFRWLWFNTNSRLKEQCIALFDSCLTH
jgi:hypothetical protein